MALTPKDVHEKQFSTVKMRTGYDMDEVDAFLDEVESSLGELITQNDDLQAQMVQGAGKPAAPAPSVSMSDAQKKWEEAEKALAESKQKLADAEAKQKAADAALAEAEAKDKAAEAKLLEARRTATATQAAPAAAAAPVAAAAAMAAPAPASTQDVPAKAFAMLEAAQRTADETVAAAKSEADTILTKAREEARKVTGALDDQRAALETKVNDLRTFERSYRTKLRETIAAQLKEFDSSASVEPKAPAS